MKKCANCASPFESNHGRRIYCSPGCRKPQHRKVEKTCDCCGATCLKQPSAGIRYAHVYCSTLCRDFARHGATSCDLPPTHWARWYGASSVWKPPVIRNSGQCAWCGRDNGRSLAAAYCSQTCRQKAKKVRRIGKQHGAAGTYTWAQLANLWDRFAKCCAYCGQATELSDTDPDHVVPLSRGGLNSIGNILPSCRPCNSDKRDLLLCEWNQDRHRRNLPPRTVSWEPADPRVQHLVVLFESSTAA